MLDMVKRFADQSAMISLAGGMEYILWLTVIGKSRTTGWRWRQPGQNGEPPRVRCCKIDNTWYISAKEIARFWDRAEAGEFEGEFSGVCAEKQAV
jgi:hypothetical protein